MKKILKSMILIFTLVILVSCTTDMKISGDNINEIKEVIDYVLSYENGYDDNMKKYISEDNFYIVNYVDFYSIYLGPLIMEEYKSEIINFEEVKDLIKIYMTIDMVAVSKETHLDEDNGNEEKLSDEAIGEDVPVEVIVKNENGNYVIKGFTEYESLDAAKELNEGFK